MPEFQIPKPVAAARRKSGIVVPHAAKWHQRLTAFGICQLFNVVAATIRFRIHDPHAFLERKDLGPAIFCFWHNRLALCVKIYFQFRRRQFHSSGVAALVSASKDGALLAKIFQNFGIHPVRGSSSRRGAQALLELTSWAQRGYDLAITPDGPRGPRYIVADGAVALAQITGLPVLPMSYHLHWKISMKSWDGFQIPLPFTICEVTAGKVFCIPREASDEVREKLRRELEAELRAITKD